MRHYRHMLRTQYDDTEAARARQTQALRSLLDHACRTVPFWRDRVQAVHLRPEDIHSVSDIAALPLLTKADLREQGERLLSTAYSKELLHRHSTSGSTGVSVTTYRDDNCQQFKRAATLRADEWSGWRRGERVACIWGNPQIRTSWRGRLRNRLLDRHYLHLDTLKMDLSRMEAFVDGMVRTPPSLLFGHAHSLYLLANFVSLQRPNAQLRPKAIISTCMVLHDFERRRIEDVFECKVTNRYGCEEVSLIACECDRHEGLHVNSDCLYVEIINDRGEPCPPGTPGRVIVTDLTNRAMPIIRYEVGDMASWAGKQCSCGRTLRLLKQVEGRVADYVVTRRGEYISGISLTENFALQVPGVVQMQIVQEKVDRFVYNIVRDQDFDESSLKRITALTTQRFGSDAHYECRFVDRIPQEASGKYRFCISKVQLSLG